MKIAAHVTLVGTPEFRLRTEMAPLAFALTGEGALEVSTGKIDAEIEAIPVVIRVPFLPPSKRTAAGLVGPFRIHIKPANAMIRSAGVGVKGQVRSEGGCTLEGSGRGEAKVDLTGELPAKILKAAIEGAFEE